MKTLQVVTMLVHNFLRLLTVLVTPRTSENLWWLSLLSSDSAQEHTQRLLFFVEGIYGICKRHSAGCVTSFQGPLSVVSVTVIRGLTVQRTPGSRNCMSPEYHCASLQAGSNNSVCRICSVIAIRSAAGALNTALDGFTPQLIFCL